MEETKKIDLSFDKIREILCYVIESKIILVNRNMAAFSGNLFSKGVPLIVKFEKDYSDFLETLAVAAGILFKKVSFAFFNKEKYGLKGSELLIMECDSYYNGAVVKQKALTKEEVKINRENAIKKLETMLSRETELSEYEKKIVFETLQSSSESNCKTEEIVRSAITVYGSKFGDDGYKYEVETKSTFFMVKLKKSRDTDFEEKSKFFFYSEFQERPAAIFEAIKPGSFA